MKMLSRADARTPVYYLPIWFQAIDGNSAVESGIHLLPMVLSLVVASILTGLLTTRIGYYIPFLIFGICVTAVGAGCSPPLASTRWWANGSATRSCTATASALPPRHPTWLRRRCYHATKCLSALRSCFSLRRSLASSSSRSARTSSTTNWPNASPVSQALLPSKLRPLAPPASSISSHLSTTPASLNTYNDSLRVCFQVALILACLSILGGLGMEWRSVKKNKENPPPKNPEGEQAIEEGKSWSNFERQGSEGSEQCRGG